MKLVPTATVAVSIGRDTVIGCGVPLGVGVGGIVAVAVEVGVGDGVPVAVAVAVGVGDGVPHGTETATVSTLHPGAPMLLSVPIRKRSLIV